MKKIIVFSLISLLILTMACNNEIPLNAINNIELSTMELNNVETQILQGKKDLNVDNSNEYVDNYIYIKEILSR